MNTVNEGAEVTLGGRLFHAVPLSHGMNGRQSCEVTFAARSVVGESQNVDVVALVHRRSSAGHGRCTEAPCCDDKHGQSVVYDLLNLQPVQVTEQMSNVVILPCVTDKAHGRHCQLC